jgi:ABC-type multidrug transport system permease subunit
MGGSSYWPIWQITVSRVKEFLRAPAAIFWVYGFPILMMLSLGTAFRDNPREEIRVDLVESPEAGSRTKDSLATITERLRSDPSFKLSFPETTESWQKRLQSGKTDLVIEVSGDGPSEFRVWDEPHRAESRLARRALEAALLRWHASEAPSFTTQHLEAPGSRYIDFLVPGMIGMGLMGGGLWGVGFVVVDMRVRKLLKRFLATPMRKSDFLLGIMFSRLIFTLGDIVFLMLFGYLVFGVRCLGSYLDLTAAVLLGAAAFAGIGLLVASRAETLETVSGLMNLVMLPMWILSGIFFSSERFPDVVQPLINALPLTALNQLLRGIMLEGKSIAWQWPQVAILAAYASITFALALRTFRWR